MRKSILAVSVFISSIVLSACSVSPPEATLQQAETEDKIQRMIVVSSGKPVQVLPAFRTFTWNEHYSKVLSAVNNSTEYEIKTHIRSELIRYLQSKGYQYQPDPMQADVVIGFLFALEDDEGDRQIQERFGLVPGLHNSNVNNPRYEKGTFLLAVLDKELKQVYWRSAMQGFVDLEKDSNDKTSNRIQTVLQLMLGDFPKAGR